MPNIKITEMNNSRPINQSNTIALMKRPAAQETRKSTSLKIKPSLYTEFAIVARRRGVEIQELLDYAMELVIKEEKRRK